MVVLVIAACLIVWFGTGYLFWRAVQYGTIKYWYLEYKEDFSNSSSARGWVVALPIICAAGPINLLIAPFSGLARSMAFKKGITLHFKVPKGTPLCKW